MPMKRCRSCSQFKDETDFSTNGRSRTGSLRLRANCKECERKRVKKIRKIKPRQTIKLRCRCGDVSSVRINSDKADGVHAYMCERCVKKHSASQQEKQEATNASNQTSA